MFPFILGTPTILELQPYCREVSDFGRNHSTKIKVNVNNSDKDYSVLVPKKVSYGTQLLFCLFFI